MTYRELNNQDEVENGLLVSRVCTTCDTRKPVSEFYFTSGGNSQRRVCKSCCSDARKARGQNKATKRRHYLRKNYGITSTQFDKLWETQGGCCKICSREMILDGPSNIPAKVQIDHCHTSGKVRGLLCFDCNTGIGKMKDSVELLQSAIEYLNNPPEILYRDKTLSELELFEAYKNNGKKRVDYSSMNIEPVERALPRGFTDDEKAAIRREYASGRVSQAYLAIKWSSHQAIIGNIVNAPEVNAK